MTGEGGARAVVVGAFGGMPWLRPMASALDAAGMLRAYVTPVALTPELERRLGRLPRRLASPLIGQLSLRPLPAGLGSSTVHRAATFTELATVAALRLKVPEGALRGLQAVAARAFDRRVAALLRPGDGAVTTYTGAALCTIERARALGVATFLDYPVAHHRFAARILAEERRLRPDYASTLQLLDMPRRRRARLEREIAAADRIFVLSSFQRRTFVEAGVEEAKLILTPLGVDLELFGPPPQPRDDGVFRVLFAGQVTQRKGLSYLVEGFRRASIPRSELVLLGRRVGRGEPWRGTPGVRWVPPVPFGELAPHYRRSDAFVLPSLVEGFPQTALQAMACGLPTIVSENTFATDVITDGEDGYVVPIRDPDAIAERLRHLHADRSERRRLGAAARRRAERFTWERYGERVVEAVRSVEAGS